MTKYRFFITSPEKARNEFQTWSGQVDINIKQVLAAGYIDQYTNRPEYFAEKIGCTHWEIITK